MQSPIWRKLVVVGKKAVVLLFVVSALLLHEAYLRASAFASDEGEGQIHAFSYATADDLVATTSPTFVKIPGMTVDINTERGPVIISFCGESNNGGVASMQVTVAVDGINVPFAPGGLQFAVVPASLPACFNWVIPDVGRGKHTVDALWKKFGGGNAFMLSRSLIVETPGLPIESNPWKQ